MAIEYDISIYCDECGCGSKLIDGDNVYCETCVEKLKEENEELKIRVEELEREVIVK